MFYDVALAFPRAFDSFLWNLIHHKMRLYVLCMYLLHIGMYYMYKNK